MRALRFVCGFVVERRSGESRHAILVKMSGSSVQGSDSVVFKASEVCEVAKIKSFVLRSWESEFPELGSASSSGTSRVYTQADIEKVLQIKHLLFDEGRPLAGVRRRLTVEEPEPVREVPLIEELLGKDLRQRLKEIQQGLQSILEVLDKSALNTSTGTSPDVAKPSDKSEKSSRSRTPTKRRQSSELRDVKKRRSVKSLPRRRISA